MSINLENNCIIELLKTEESQKNIEPIYQYLKSLKYFLYLLKKYSLLKYDNTIKELAKVMKVKKICKNELIIQQGEIGQNFYIVLNGQLKILILRPYEYYMSEEEYILYLLQSRLNNQTEIIHQCKQFNSLVYPIPYDNFDIFIQDLSNKETKAGLYLDSQNVIKKAKELYDIISLEKNDESKIKNNNMKIIIKPEDYIKKHKVSDNIIYNTKLINNFINNNNINENINDDIKDDIDKIKLMMKDRKKVIIPNYEIFSELETGSFFGQFALGKQGGIQECSIICVKDESYLGYINKKDYELLIHNPIDKRNTQIFNIILYYSLYRSINQVLFEKKYLSFFRDRVFDVNNIIFNEGDEFGEMYFIIDGEYELSVNKNIIEVNEMIIKYKEVLQKINRNNKINNNYLNTEEEIKQNNSLILNQKFRTNSANKLIMDKRYIKLNILYKKDIIGLADVFLYNNESENYNKNNDNNNFNKPTVIYGEQVNKKCLVTCKCLTYNCHTYCLNNNIFNNLYYNEGNYNISTKILEIKKICSCIERLQSHKEYIFDLVDKEQNKYSKKIKKLKFFTKNPKFHQKGKLDTNIYHNIITDIKTSLDVNDKFSKLNDTIKKQYKKSCTLNNNLINTPRFNKKIKTKDKFDFTKQIFPSISTNKKSNSLNKYSLNLKLLQRKKIDEKEKNDTIYNHLNDISQDNLAKLLIHDFLYEKYFYNYNFNDLKNNNFNSQKNFIKDNYFKTINVKTNYNNNISNIKNDDSTQKDSFNSFSNEKKKNFIIIKDFKNIKINKDINKDINNNKSLCQTNIEISIKPEIFKSNINSLSIDGNNTEKKFQNKIINTISKNDNNKIRLTKIVPNKIYDPLAFDKFNNYFNINFRRKYLNLND